jgi:hypothetical protein
MGKGSRVAPLVAAAALAVFTATGAVAARASGGTMGFAEAVQGLTKLDGLVPVYVDKTQGRIFLSLPAPDASGVAGRYLYMTALETGLGSAPVGLDRDAPSEAQILVFRRVGKKVLAEIENPKFRATGAPAAEQDAARDSFAVSTLWAGEVAAESPDGRILVEISSFLTRDSMRIADALARAGEGSWRLSPDLTVADPSAVKAFPENIELAARETFIGEKPGPEVDNIAPDPKQITLIVHHSLVKLPEPGFKPRRYDPRSGAFDTQVVDFAAPLGDRVVYGLADRFRLEKVDPAAPRSRVKKPIVFYVDRAAPEPIRSALVEGASWWKKAFEAAGYIDAYRVEVLPEGVDPLDARYNVIHWVDRATRGWSYGEGIVDPRTGEIVKGSVLLGALRVRQDMNIFEALVGADKDGSGGPDDPVQVSLARMRQLAAHETGHALGFVHNFAGSTIDRASVMDYPAPRIGLKDGHIDLSDAYGVGVGKWDLFTVDWLYGDTPDGAAGEAMLRAKTKAAFDAGLRFVGDGDSRPLDAGHPWGSLWDDGADPVDELNRLMGVRRVAIDGFGLEALKPGEPLSDLRLKFVPIYLLHRYQAEAAAKLVGGVAFPYGVAGDGREAAAPVAPAAQRAALDALLKTVSPAELEVPAKLLPLLSGGSSDNPDRQFVIEVFQTAGGPVFDPLAAADTAADMTFAELLAPPRLNRVAIQHGTDPSALGVGELADRLIAAAFAPCDPRLAEIRRRVEARAVLSLSATARSPQLSPTAAAILDERLQDLAGRMEASRAADAADRDLEHSLARLIRDPRELDAALKERTRKPVTPPGMPIGEDDWFAAPPPSVSLR